MESLVSLTTKHLATGTPCPPIGIGVLRCYSMKYCPYAQRTRLVLLAKNIKHEVVNVNLRAKPEWLFEKNPLGKVPILEQDGKVIYESLITCDYLEDKYPNPPLYPSDPWQKAQDRILMEEWSTIATASYKTYFAVGNPEVMSKAFDEIRAGLDKFEVELEKRGTVFFGGEKPGMLDYMIWPWAERLSLCQELAGDLGSLPEDRYPNIFSWISRMKEDPVVIATYFSPEIHVKFRKTQDYDMEI